MPGFVGCYTSPAYPEGSELVDLAKAGYCAFAPVVSEMSYGCIKSGLVLPWKVSADAHIRELVKLLGNKKVYIKIINHHVVSKNYLVKTIDEEIAQLLKLPMHPNVAPIYEMFDSTANLCTYLVEESPNGKGLMEYMTENKHSEKKARNIINQMTCALRHCHKHDVIHGDLHSNAVRVDKSGNVKILDFGLSPKLSGRDSKYLHTGTKYAFKAPEFLFTQRNQTVAGDMYSLGVIMYEMLHGTLPFTGAPEVLEGKMRLQDIQFGPNISKEAIMLMRKLLAPDPWKRPRPKDVLEHPWTCGIRIDAKLNKIKTPAKEKPVTLPEVNYRFFEKLRKVGHQATFNIGEETIVLKSRIPDKNRAYAMGVNYGEMCKPARSKTSKGKDLTSGIQACVKEVKPVRKTGVKNLTKWEPKPDPFSNTFVFDDSLSVIPLKKPPVCPISQRLARKSAPSTPLNNNDGKDTLKEMLSTEAFGSEPAPSESEVSIVGFGGSESESDGSVRMPPLRSKGDLDPTPDFLSNGDEETPDIKRTDNDIGPSAPMIKDADNGVGQLACEIETVISQVAGSWLDSIFDSAKDAKDDDKLIQENKPGKPVSHAASKASASGKDVASEASASGTKMSYKSDRGSPIPSDLGSMEVEVEHAPVSPSPPPAPEREHASGHGLHPECQTKSTHNQHGNIFGFLSEMRTGIYAETPEEQLTCVEFDDDQKTQPPKAHEPQPPPAEAKKTLLIPRPPGKPCPVTRGRARASHRMIVVPPPKRHTAPIRGLNLNGSAMKISNSPKAPCKPQRLNPRVSPEKSRSALEVLPPEPPSVLLNINQLLPSKPPTFTRRPNGSLSPIKAIHVMPNRKEVKSRCVIHPKQQSQGGSIATSPKAASQINFMDVQEPTDSPWDNMPKSPPCDNWIKIQTKAASQSHFHAEQASSDKNSHCVPKPPSRGKSTLSKNKAMSQSDFHDEKVSSDKISHHVPKPPSRGKSTLGKNKAVSQSDFHDEEASSDKNSHHVPKPPSRGKSTLGKNKAVSQSDFHDEEASSDKNSHHVPKPPSRGKSMLGKNKAVSQSDFHDEQVSSDKISHHVPKPPSRGKSMLGKNKAVSQSDFHDEEASSDKNSHHVPKPPSRGKSMLGKNKAVSQSDFHDEQVSSDKISHHVPKPPSRGKSMPGKNKAVSQRNLADQADFSKSHPYFPQQPSQGKKMPTKLHVVMNSLLDESSDSVNQLPAKIQQRPSTPPRKLKTPPNEKTLKVKKTAAEMEAVSHSTATKKHMY